jgi:hypothetical protein
MANFMGPMAPPQAAPQTPPQLDIRTAPSQRAQFKQFMQSMRPMNTGMAAPAPLNQMQNLSAAMPQNLSSMDIFQQPVQYFQRGGVSSPMSEEEQINLATSYYAPSSPIEATAAMSGEDVNEGPMTVAEQRTAAQLADQQAAQEDVDNLIYDLDPFSYVPAPQQSDPSDDAGAIITPAEEAAPAPSPAAKRDALMDIIRGQVIDAVSRPRPDRPTPNVLGGIAGISDIRSREASMDPTFFSDIAYNQDYGLGYDVQPAAAVGDIIGAAERYATQGPVARMLGMPEKYIPSGREAQAYNIGQMLSLGGIRDDKTGAITGAKAGKGTLDMTRFGNVQYSGMPDPTYEGAFKELINPKYYPGANGSSDEDDVFAGGSVNPCPPGYQLINGVCQPIEEAASSGVPNVLGGFGIVEGTEQQGAESVPLPQSLPAAPPSVLVPSTRAPVDVSQFARPATYPVGQQFDIARILAPLLPPRGPRAMEDGGEVLDEAAGNFLQSFMPAQ